MQDAYLTLSPVLTVNGSGPCVLAACLCCCVPQRAWRCLERMRAAGNRLGASACHRNRICRAGTWRCTPPLTSASNKNSWWAKARAGCAAEPCARACGWFQAMVTMHHSAPGTCTTCYFFWSHSGFFSGTGVCDQITNNMCVPFAKLVSRGPLLQGRRREAALKWMHSWVAGLHALHRLWICSAARHTHQLGRAAWAPVQALCKSCQPGHLGRAPDRASWPRS